MKYGLRFVVLITASLILIQIWATPLQSSATITGEEESEPRVSVCTLTAPADIVVSTDPGQCGAVVTFSTPAASGECGVVLCSSPNTAFYSQGTTTVQCAAAAGPSASFTITVSDTETPTIPFPGSIEIGNDRGQASARLSYSYPVADNCPGVNSPVCSPESGSVLPLGTTSLTCTASDAAGNVTRRTAAVTVQDTEAPHIRAPHDLAVSPDPDLEGAIVNYPRPAVWDNAPGVGVACSPAPGTRFPIGSTLVTCTAADAAGNTASTSFAVTVMLAEKILDEKMALLSVGLSG